MIFPCTCPSCNQSIKIDTEITTTEAFDCPACGTRGAITIPLKIDRGVIVGGRYELDEQLDASELDEVYRAKVVDSGELVRLHIMDAATSADEETIARFRREIEILESIKHDHLFGIRDSGFDANNYYFTTNFEPGISIADKLGQMKVLQEPEALRYATSVVFALDYLWNTAELIHRNIKPKNIFVTDQNVVKLTGFGIAKSFGDILKLTAPGHAMGSPEYMSPEQINAQSDLDFRSDMYSLGIVLYEMLVGEPPFKADSTALLIDSHCNRPHVPARKRNAQVSSASSKMIDRMLSKKRDDRYQSWTEVSLTLKNTLDNLESAESGGMMGRFRKWFGKNRT